MSDSTNCPICSEIMHAACFDKAVYLHCSLCHVAWFDESVFSKVVNELPVPNVATESAKTLDGVHDLPCPRCLAKIEPSEYSYQSGIEIHKCKLCNGLLLSESQLNAIVYHLRGPDKSRAIANFLLRDSLSGWDKFGRYIKSKIAASLFVVFSLVVMVVKGGNFEQVSSMATVLFFPLAMICFSDVLGRLTRVRFGMFRPQITTSTPGVMVALAGWILMLAIAFWVAAGVVYHAESIT